MIDLVVARFVWTEEEETSPATISPDKREYDAVNYFCGSCESWMEIGKGHTYSIGCRECGAQYPYHDPCGVATGNTLVFKG